MEKNQIFDVIVYGLAITTLIKLGLDYLPTWICLILGLMLGYVILNGLPKQNGRKTTSTTKKQ